MRTAVKWGAARWPAASLAAASAVGWATQAFGRGVDADSIRYVLPELEPAEVEAARRATWSASLQSNVLDAALAVPGAPRPYPRLRSGPDPRAIRPPAVLATFHVGPVHALGLLFEQLPAEVLALEAGNQVKAPPRPERTVLHVGAEEWQRAAAFRRALETLRSGGFVFLAVDGHGSNLVEVPLFGRKVGLARGAFALSRMSGAPILPVMARWRGAAVEIVAGDAIYPADEHTTATALARWMESRVRETPGEILPSLVELVRTRGRPLADDACERRRP
jgi:lauroyl/myristoyl acyltransferase